MVFGLFQFVQDALPFFQNIAHVIFDNLSILILRYGADDHAKTFGKHIPDGAFQAATLFVVGNLFGDRDRSEERRVGKECRCRWWRRAYNEKKKHRESSKLG